MNPTRGRESESERDGEIHTEPNTDIHRNSTDWENCQLAGLLLTNLTKSQEYTSGESIQLSINHEMLDFPPLHPFLTPYSYPPTHYVEFINSLSSV